MSEIPPTDESRLICREEVESLLADAKLTVPPEHVDDFRVLLSALDEAAQHMLQFDDYQQTVDLELYPRTDIHIPEDTDRGGWATKATVVCTRPTSKLLSGRTVALKDNIALAGVRCLNGTPAVDGEWIPTIDATVATRILDAGATILGKAACENGCFGGVSDTACTGPVENPWAAGYSTGGSSSGSGRLVASGQVDLALGCDQGGSIRLPAAHCGLVGHKPTWGLVPYTGVLSLEATIDHVGPMTKTVADCALLMDVIAGADGIDDRVPRMARQGTFNFAECVEETLAKDLPLVGLKIGILDEGFASSRMDPGVEKLVRAAAAKFAEYGATVTSYSIPLHTESAPTWMCALPIAGMRQGILGDMTGRKQLFMTGRIKKTDGLLSQAAFNAYGPGGQSIFLRGRYLEKKYGPTLHARAMNLMRRLTDEYDKAFEEFDLLVMPTAPMLTQKTMTAEQKLAENAGPLRLLNRNLGVTHNTAPFDFSGHPALSIPVGFASPADDPEVKLPVGMQLVGRQYEDAMCMQAAAVWEKMNDWKTIYTGDL
ncbi:hypothetical protein SEUCBS140593_007964 [Sporothrix eucalyptigena]|uniref:Amidase domain-containing protein n=1 Tax=Sporothrix eucalyptigena TaxID=1812306 RepID=A0ABP0CHJ1_9PEZI